MGVHLASELYDALAGSRAISTGLISDLEDTALLIDDIREDRISDLVTNIIREHLIEYTQRTAGYYGIELQPGLTVGPVWDCARAQWTPSLTELPVPSHGGPLLLVPKAIVGKLLACDPGKYYRHYVLPYLQQVELQRRSPLVQVLKSGKMRVTKKAVEEKYLGSGPRAMKSLSVQVTTEHPDLLSHIKRAGLSKAPASAEVIAGATETDLPDLDVLAEKVTALEPGNRDANLYERAVESLLTALFHPHLVNPIRQEQIHEGRKRIDISYTNASKEGFFAWLGNHYPAANIVVECKNYTRPVGNPEYDQISGRFSPSRGKVGLLVYRNYEEKSQVIQSCRDTAKDDRGWIIPLDDCDLLELIEEGKGGSVAAVDGLLRERFRLLSA